VDYDAIILAGGRARRVGGIDKALIEIRGRTLLDTAIAAAGAARSIVVVGPERPGFESVVWAREAPPGSGPVHALSAGLAVGSAPLVTVLAADLPFVTADAVQRLAAGVGKADGAVAVDGSGRDQYLLAVYRRDALLASLNVLPSSIGASLGEAVDTLRLVRIRDDSATTDCDTWDDVTAARRRSEEGEGVRGVD
jgi:molybdopterin-guanine dinucleotide biosynthesis protein A